MLFMTITNKNCELLSTINNLREEMINTGIKEGLASKKTIKLSQELDEYITKYQINLIIGNK